MNQLVLHPTDTAQWYALINEAEARAAHHLGEELESYLVFLLMRFMSQPKMAESIIAIEFLRSLEQTSTLRHDTLKDLGDQCLLISGLFPGRAERFLLKVDYFVTMGQLCYHLIGIAAQHAARELFIRLSDNFLHLQKVLQIMRQTASHQHLLNLEKRLTP